MKNIVYIGNENSDQMGAVGTHTRGIINGFVSNDSVNTIHGVFFEDVIPTSLGKKVIVHTVPQLQSNINFFNKFLRFINYSKLYSKAAKLNVKDPVYYIRFGLDSFLALFFFKKQFIIEYNDLTKDQFVFALDKGQWNGLKALIRKAFINIGLIELIEKISFNKSILVVTVTEQLKEHVISQSTTSCKVIENAASINLIEIANQFYEANGIKQDQMVSFGHVGTLTFWDGLEEFLTALALTKHKNNIKVNILGDGAIKSKLQQLVKTLKLNNVYFFEPRSHKEAFDFLLNEVDVVLLLKTINSYGLSPIKYYEGLAAGKYLLCTDIPNINKVEELNHGTVVNFPIQQPELINEIDLIVKNIFSIRQKSTEINEFSRKHHTWESRCDDIVKYIYSLKSKDL